MPCSRRHDGIGRGRLAAAALSLIAALLVMLAAGGAAFAHASLVDTVPADGAIASQAPDQFRLHFNEPVSPTALALIRPDGTRTALGRFELDGTTVVIPAPDALQDGSYGLSWRVVSEDGHPVGGTLVFSVGTVGGAPESATGPDAAAGAGWPLRGAIWATKLLLYIGLFIGAGGVFFTRWIGGRTGPGDGLMTVAMAAGLVAALLSVGLQGLDMLGRPLSGILAPDPWRTAFASTYVRTAILAVAAFLCALAARRGIAPRSLSLAGYLGIGLALMASGHVSSAEPHWLTRPAIFVHALTIAFWIGALVPLAGVFAGRAPDAAAVLARFSRIIPWSVALLVAAGIVMARVQVGQPRALLDTAYGWVFALKLALLALLFAVAAVNRFRLTAPVARGEAPAVTRFRRSVLVELALVLAIFATVALWRFTPPPRAIEAAEAARQAEAGPVLLHMDAGGNMVMVRVAPGRAGPVTAEVRIADMEGNALPAKEVALILANPAAGIEPIRRPAAAPDAHGAWRIADLILPAPGDWTLRVEALISDFDLLTAEGTVAIGR